MIQLSNKFQSIKIQHNILFMLKTSILTLFKVNIEILVINCRKKRIIQTNYPFFFVESNIALSATRTFKPSIIISFLLKVCQNIQAIPESSFANWISHQ